MDSEKYFNIKLKLKLKYLTEKDKRSFIMWYFFVKALLFYKLIILITEI